MIKSLTFLCLLIAVLVNAQEKKYINREGEFEPNELVYTFGNNVKLRSEPQINSIIFLKIPIAEKLTVLEKSDKKMHYNGINWNWYKVNYNGQIGYVLGGLLSQDTKIIDKDTYLISLKKINKKFYILTRLVHNKNYVEHINLFNTEICFSIKVFDNQGLYDVNNMIYIDYVMEGCLINGGGYYLFNTKSKLQKCIELFSEINVDIYGYHEEVIFPNQQGGKKGKIIWKAEKYELNEETSEEKNKKRLIEFIWKGKELTPKI